MELAPRNKELYKNIYINEFPSIKMGSFDTEFDSASNDVNFARGTDRGSNIFAEYLICVLFPMVKNHFFINI
jgi:hypothetical protein